MMTFAILMAGLVLFTAASLVTLWQALALKAKLHGVLVELDAKLRATSAELDEKPSADRS